MERQTKPALLVLSLLAAEEPPRAQAVRALERVLGPAFFLSPPLAFDHSGYYAFEMGGPLARRLLALRGLVEPWRLAEIKALCLGIESELALDGRRRVNIDPGLLSAGGLTLATTKQRQHRVAIAPGLWAEPTLLYQHGGFQPLPWTYPDYAGDEMRRWLAILRGRYLWQLKRA